MYKLSKQELPKITHLFKNWNETLIWSCLQGHLGEAWVNSITKPTSAQIVVGDFCFFAGIPEALLAKNIPSNFQSDYMLMIPKTQDWNPIIEKVHNKNSIKTTRYAIKKEPNIFNKALLEQYVANLADNFSLRLIDESLFHKALSEEWSHDFCSVFPSYEIYNKHGLGVMAFDGETPVSGASSYAFYDGGIEVEVDTKEKYRRKGLATACCAKLILECIDKNLYPSWDAHTMWSVALAEKLGYHFDKEYTTYIVSNLR